MGLSEFALALLALLGTLLVPFLMLHQMLRLKRRTIRATAPVAPRGIRR
jgi:hypothetical protein